MKNIKNEKQKLSKLIEEKRLKLKISKTKLCKEADISRTQYNLILKNQKNYTINTLLSILKILEMKIKF